MVAAIFLLANLAGYLAARHDAGNSGVDGAQSAAELMESSQSGEAVPDDDSSFRRAMGTVYRSFYDSWDQQSAGSIIFDNVGIMSILCIFSVIPLTGLMALYKELEVGFLSGSAAGLNAAVNGHLRFVVATPHLFFETPAILLTTALTLRAAIVVTRRKYGAGLASRASLAYSYWLQAIPLLLVLFVVAGIIEGYLTPLLVKALLEP